MPRGIIEESVQVFPSLLILPRRRHRKKAVFSPLPPPARGHREAPPL